MNDWDARRAAQKALNALTAEHVAKLDELAARGYRGALLVGADDEDVDIAVVDEEDMYEP